MNEWEAECMWWMGEVLTGKYSHYCWEWDGLPIDETCMEFAACLCYPDNEEVQSLREKLWEEFDDWQRRKKTAKIN